MRTNAAWRGSRVREHKEEGFIYTEGWSDGAAVLALPLDILKAPPTLPTARTTHTHVHTPIGSFLAFCVCVCVCECVSRIPSASHWNINVYIYIFFVAYNNFLRKVLFFFFSFFYTLDFSLSLSLFFILSVFHHVHTVGWWCDRPFNTFITKANAERLLLPYCERAGLRNVIGAGAQIASTVLLPCWCECSKRFFSFLYNVYRPI